MLKRKRANKKKTAIAKLIANPTIKLSFPRPTRIFIVEP